MRYGSAGHWPSPVPIRPGVPPDTGCRVNWSLPTASADDRLSTPVTWRGAECCRRFRAGGTRKPAGSPAASRVWSRLDWRDRHLREEERGPSFAILRVVEPALRRAACPAAGSGSRIGAVAFIYSALVHCSIRRRTSTASSSKAPSRRTPRDRQPSSQAVRPRRASAGRGR